MALICAIVLSACMTEEKAQMDNGHSEQSSATSDHTPSEDVGPVTQESPLGYSMAYDPTVFTLDDTENADIFTYNM